MAEYIERTEALEITTRTCGDYAAAWSEIRKLPAADVAPVVRCRNCANFRQNAHGVCYCNNPPARSRRTKTKSRRRNPPSCLTSNRTTPAT